MELKKNGKEYISKYYFFFNLRFGRKGTPKEVKDLADEYKMYAGTLKNTTDALLNKRTVIREKSIRSLKSTGMNP